jgi:hypothetical protein
MERFVGCGRPSVAIVTAIQASSYTNSFGDMMTDAPRSRSPDIELGTYTSQLSRRFGHLTPSVNLN